MIAKQYEDNISNKLRYYKNRYGYIINKNDYNEFKKNINVIKKIYKFHDFICNVNQYKIPYQYVEIYAKNYSILQKGFSIKPYLLKLKKFDPNQKHTNQKLDESQFRFNLTFN